MSENLPGLPTVEVDSLTRYRWAQNLYDHGDFADAARELERLLEQVESEDVRHGLTEARLLLARAYYRSAQLGRAERTARAVLAEAPTEGYAALLLARTLERQGRRTPEVARLKDVARAYGVAGAD